MSETHEDAEASVVPEDPGMTELGMREPEMIESEMIEPGMTEPGTTEPGTTELKMTELQLFSEVETDSMEAQGDPDLGETERSTTPVYEALYPEAVEKHGLAVVAPSIERRWEYHVYEEPTVSEVLETYEIEGEPYHLVRFKDGHEEEVSNDDLVDLEGGEEALADLDTQASSQSTSEDGLTVPSIRRRVSQRARANIRSLVDLSSEDELSFSKSPRTVTRRKTRESSRTLQSRKSSRIRSSQSQLSLTSTPSESSSDSSFGQKPRRRARPGKMRSARLSTQKNINYDDMAALQEPESEDSDDSRKPGKRRRLTLNVPGSRSGHKLLREPKRPSPVGTRRSGRSVRTGDMQEIGEDDIPERIVATGVIKYVGAKESFKKLPIDDEFRLRHHQTCDTCYESGDVEDKGKLVFCQGCTLSYHQRCLGARNSREHLVTKIAEGDFVLQCRRCISITKQRDPIAPIQGKCFSCLEMGAASEPFRERKSLKQEQKDREENNGEDPISEVSPEQINNVNNVLFRCLSCYRACHFHHLEAQDSTIAAQQDLDDSTKADQRYLEYCQDWTCKLCADAPADVDSLVAWRPMNAETYEPGTTTDMVEEEAKEYLVKFKKLPYTESYWAPGAWIWGVTSATMRKAFAKRDNMNSLLKMKTEDAIPEDFMRVDIIFDIEYTNVVKLHTIKVDMARIKEVKRALVKFKGLGYDDVVWIQPPRPEETERWADYKAAYEDWVMGLHIAPPNTHSLSSHLSKVRSQNFAEKIKLDKQPATLSGGELMQYQLDGLNWLYYQWYRRQNAILADEMGLGKTIQIIGFLSTLKELHGCWPFLVVVPNSTCPNWRREIKQWAPGLRVVTYYGSAESRKLSLKHELFPGGPKDLRCHVVVTSYDAAQDDEFRKAFRGVHWAALIVDEGQRLKNDTNILYGALNSLKIPFKVLLTGTPLQNNPRELFNLLQFLDPSFDAKALEEEYSELTKENVPDLHKMLKPFFLRRTKAEVLTFLPGIAQIIVPVSLTVLQKKLYKSILAKNPELIKSIIGARKGAPKQADRANLNNILMQLRKCLCHPFVYSRAIEEKSRDPQTSHRNLVDASSKLQLLEIMLPKLQERGHRVLIFSQFLDMLDMVEDFLDGLGLYFQRLDGNVGSLQKQKRIDEFNAPGSPLFAFLLSTRAGGVGINLATADTVIILDPDFNPHQDIQALSRAHRIGQKKKVLVFQLTTRGSAEEKIMQIGKKKMALDHVLIDQIDAEDDAGLNLESILRYGTEALFNDNGDGDIHYDSASVDKLLDRSQVEDTQPGKDNSAESQFSFAKVWVNDKGTLEEGMEDAPDRESDPSIWDKILKERELEAAAEAAARVEDFGRGRRKRQAVDYSKQIGQGVSSPFKHGGGGSDSDSSDTDFQAPGEESDGDVDMADNNPQSAAHELDGVSAARPSRSLYAPQAPPAPPVTGPNKVEMERNFRPANVPLTTPIGVPLAPAGNFNMKNALPDRCIACNGFHVQGYCPLKMAGVEYCALCGLAHYGNARTCPHLNSVTQLRAMVDSLKHSNEPEELKALAKKKVVGIIGDLNQRKRRKAAELEARKASQAANARLGGSYLSPYEPVEGGEVDGGVGK